MQIESIANDLLGRLNRNEESQLSITRKGINMNESGDTGFKELETIGMVSRASEGDVQRGLIEIIEIIK